MGQRGVSSPGREPYSVFSRRADTIQILAIKFELFNVSVSEPPTCVGRNTLAAPCHATMGTRHRPKRRLGHHPQSRSDAPPVLKEQTVPENNDPAFVLSL